MSLELAEPKRHERDLAPDRLGAEPFAARLDNAGQVGAVVARGRVEHGIDHGRFEQLVEPGLELLHDPVITRRDYRAELGPKAILLEAHLDERHSRRRRDGWRLISRD